MMPEDPRYISVFIVEGIFRAFGFVLLGCFFAWLVGLVL